MNAQAARRASEKNGIKKQERPLRVCHLGKYYPPSPGGMETHLQGLARGQAALGCQVQVVCVNHKGRGTSIAEELDGSVRVLRIGRLAALSGLDFCPTLWMVLRRLRSDALDIVHLHTPNPTMLMPLVMGCAVPLAVTHHSDIVRQKVLRHVHSPFERIVYGRAQVLLSDSAGYIEGSEVLQRYRTKVEALPLGIDLDPYLAPSPSALAFRDKLRATHGGPLWLSVCRLVYYKGIDVALEALRYVAGKLIVIGTGPLEAALKQRAVAFGVADRVIWLGHADPDQLVGSYQAATAFWFPSVARSEGFGLVQVEAMASGCPVINTAIPGSGVCWVSLHQISGLTVPVGNAKAFAASAQRLLDEKGLRDQLGRQGRERACSEFAEQKMAERSLEIYSRVLSRVAAG